MNETALVSDNAENAAQRAAILETVSEVLGVPAIHHRDRLLESGEPPLQVVIDIIGIAGALASLYMLGGGPTMRELYERMRRLAPKRKVGVYFEARGEGLPTIQYITAPETPNEALAAMVEDSKREVPDPKSFRWWYDERWMTLVEYTKWKGDD